MKIHGHTARGSIYINYDSSLFRGAHHHFLANQFTHSYLNAFVIISCFKTTSVISLISIGFEHSGSTIIVYFTSITHSESKKNKHFSSRFWRENIFPSRDKNAKTLTGCPVKAL